MGAVLSGVAGAIVVHTGERQCVVHVGSGLHAEIARLAPPSRTAAVIVDDAIFATHGMAVVAALRNDGRRVSVHRMECREDQKVLATVERLSRELTEAGADRGALVVAVGGGIVGDVAGFVAASFLRGLPLVQVPTTLLAMVDASIGGKTAVNLRLADGTLAKNMVGAFWQPWAVVADVLTLSTLDERQMRAGLAECIKHGMIADRELRPFIISNRQAILAREAGVLSELVRRSVAVKAGVVARDEREAGERALLNLGHTYGHAIEARCSEQVNHGEAVAIGLVAASAAAVQAGLMKPAEAAEVRQQIAEVGLPVQLPVPLRAKILLDAMGVDKKRRRGRIALVLPRGDGTAVVVPEAEPELIAAGWRAVGASMD